MVGAVAAATATKPVIRVMVVDDSAVIRGVLTRWLEAERQIKVVAAANNGKVALERVKAANPDIIVLDIEMPEMDGITALPLLLQAVPQAKIVMASTLTQRNAEISIKALSLGATDYLAKPTSVAASGDAAEAFRRDLLSKILGLAQAKAPRTIGAAGARDASSRGPIKLRAASSVRPQIVAIGCSTGGPQALQQVIPALKGGIKDVPVLITQHMPATFTAILAEHLSRSSGIECKEGKAGMPIEPGKIYVAPGDNHMLISGRNGKIELSQSPPENFCRPAVDPMFRSISAAYGSAMLGVVLTGMGYDGREGSKVVTAAGGTVIAQDEASSVVWGMPAGVALAGLASAVLPLKSVAGEIRKFLGT